MKNYIIPEWILKDVLDTLRQVKNYRDDIRTCETALDRSISNSTKLLGTLECDTTKIDYIQVDSQFRLSENQLKEYGEKGYNLNTIGKDMFGSKYFYIFSKKKYD